MPRVDLDQPLQASVLDRLVDANPELEREPTKSRGQHLAELRQSVRRDLEWLLNTRRRCLGWPGDLGELEESLVNYGIPDFTAASMSSEDQRDQFRAAVETVIRRFEPRFQRVEVILLDNSDQLDRTLRFRIEALIYADPAPEAMIFDSVLEPSTRAFQVVSKGDG
jgi:type VI secretion system protein ImpF